MSDGDPERRARKVEESAAAPAGGAGTGDIDAGGSAAEHHLNPWLVAVAVMLGTFMVVLDTTVVNVSLPYIAGSLSATIEESTWALTAYLAANAIILPLTGWLSTLLGRKRLLMIAVVGFTLSSVVCGMSVNLLMLVVFRVLQGMTGGVMQPISQAVLLEAFPPEGRGKAMGFWGLGIVVAPILGPVLGGWLTDHWSWRWVFYINVPVGIVAVIAQQLFLYDPPYLKRERRGIDWWGIVFLAVGIGALQISLDKGQQNDWLQSAWIAWLLVLAVLGLGALIGRELTVHDPVLDLRVFRERTYATGVFLMTLLGFILFGSLVLLPVMLQTLLGYPPFAAGVTLAPRGIGSFIAMPIVGIFTGRVDPRKLLAGGLVLTAVTMFWYAGLNLDAGYWDLFWPQFFQGAALGLLFVPLTTISMDPIPNHEMGNATSVFNLTRNVGGSVGIAVVETMLARSRQTHVALLGQQVSEWNPVAREMLLRIQRGFMARGVDAVTASRQALAATWGMVQRQAAMLSFLDVFRLLGFLVLAMIPFVLLMRRPRSGGHAVMAGE